VIVRLTATQSILARFTLEIDTGDHQGWGPPRLFYFSPDGKQLLVTAWHHYYRIPSDRVPGMDLGFVAGWDPVMIPQLLREIGWRRGRPPSSGISRIAFYQSWDIASGRKLKPPFDPWFPIPGNEFDRLVRDSVLKQVTIGNVSWPTTQFNYVNDGESEDRLKLSFNEIYWSPNGRRVATVCRTPHLGTYIHVWLAPGEPVP
jgi:hypothetical protein